MAQRVNVIILCDLDDKPDASTTTITVDGSTVEIDLCGEHREELDLALENYFANGRRSGRRRVTRSSSPAGLSSANDMSKDERTKVRQWARQAGYDVGDRGRIATEIVEAYQAAQR